MTKNRIRSWINQYGEDDVYVSLSGGKDSAVVFDIVRQDYPNVKGVFINTGLEYPSVSSFAKSQENVDVVNPSKTFVQVLTEYGYPIIGKELAQRLYEYKPNGYAVKYFDGSKKGDRYDLSRYAYLLDAPFRISHKCCSIMKKNSAKKYEKQTGRKPIIATMAEESALRTQKWLQRGCNAFDINRPMSTPIAFWTEQDILQYIYDNGILIADAYGEVVKDGDTYKTTGCARTGCVFCMFGIKSDLKRFARLHELEPQLYDYVMRGGKFDDEGKWIPSNGLGYWFVCKWLQVHGDINIELPNYEKYENEYGNWLTEKYLKKGVMPIDSECSAK